MTNGKRNRQAGHSLERGLAEVFRSIGFPHVVTTRSESRSRDNQKIDLMNKDERINGRFPYNVQAKNSTAHLKYAKLLSEIPTVPDVMNVIIHKQTEKVGTRFLPRGQYAILYLKDFLTLIQQRDEQRNVRGGVVHTTPRRAAKTVLSAINGNSTAGVSNPEDLPPTH